MKSEFEKLSDAQVARMASALEVVLDIMGNEAGIGFENDLYAKISVADLDCLRELKSRKESAK